jgi:hypothetical protein
MMNFLHRLHMPETYPVQAVERAPEVLATWLRYSPSAIPDQRDWEDWAENAVMLHTIDKASGGDVKIIGHAQARLTSGDRTSMVPSNPSAPNAYMYGIWKPSDTIEFAADYNMVGNNMDVVKSVQLYPVSPVFQRAAQRRFHVVDADADAINQAFLDLHEAGHREIFVKTRFKETAKRLTLPDTPKDLWKALLRDDAFEWFLVAHEGARDCLFVQETFEPTKEYRVIVVGDKAVTGAGCIEAFTPLDNNGKPFDDRMEAVRNRSEAAADPKTAERYREFATQYAADWAAENGDHMIYSLDLAVDGNTDEVVAIEMNPMLNLGLYATDTTALIDAIVARFG